MNKFFATLLAVVAFSATAFAQASKGTNEFGITVGYNAANVSADNMTNDSYRSGFNAGIALDHYFSDRWSIKGKLLYDQKGWNSGFISNGSNSYTTNYQLDYITIPVMANWHFGRTRNWYLNFGPYIGFLLKGKETTGLMDVKQYFNTVDGGLDVGIGIKFPIAEKAKFFIEVNGAGGVGDILKNNTGSTLRNGVSQFNVGINF